MKSLTCESKLNSSDSDEAITVIHKKSDIYGQT